MGFCLGREISQRSPFGDSRTLQSTQESGGRAGFDGAKKKKGSKVHSAVDTAANEQDRAQVATLAQQVQQVTGGTIEVAYADQGYTGNSAAEQAKQASIKLEIVKHHKAKRGFVLLPKRWVMERTFGWLGRFRRLARDDERLTTTLAGWHWLAFLGLMLRKLVFENA